MTFEPSIWAKFHGAFTHFPIALMIVSAFCDTVSLFIADAEACRGFRFGGAISLVIGAFGGSAAILSGLVTARWQFWGHATLLMHHRFVWPGFALMTILAIWRISVRGRITRRPTAFYIVLMFLAAALMSAAGYWGGELLNEG
jgi:uncharacterized membrane protein